jgi:hypothetical protein
MEPNATPSPAATTATTATVAGSKTLLYVGIAVAAIVVVGAVALGAYLISQNNKADSSAAALAQVDPAKPDAAVQTLNNEVIEILKAAEQGPDALVKQIGDLGSVTQSEFAVSLNYTSNGGNIVATLDGAYKQVNSTSFLVNGTLVLNGAIPVEGLDFELDDVTMDFVVSEEKAYIKFSNVPFVLAYYIASMGMEEDQWYSISLDTNSANNPFESVVDSFNDADDRQAQLEQLEREGYFKSATATSPRTILGQEVPCMYVQLNAEAMDGATQAELDASTYEFCKPANNLLPLYVGATNINAETGDETLIGFTWKTANTDVNIEIPDGALSIDSLLQSSMETLY